MSIILYGVTSGGTSVPIEVTDEGKLVVDTSKFPTDEFIKQGDDIEAGKITAASTIRAGGEPWNYQQGSAVAVGTVSSVNTSGATVFYGGDVGGSQTFKVSSDGNIETEGSITADDVRAADGDVGFRVAWGGADIGDSTYLGFKINGASQAFAHYNSALSKATTTIDINGNIDTVGSCSLAGGQAGFTSDGELYFYSRGTRYKAVVQGGNMAAEPFTRATELQEKAAKLKEPRTQDIVPED